MKTHKAVFTDEEFGRGVMFMPFLKGIKGSKILTSDSTVNSIQR